MLPEITTVTQWEFESAGRLRNAATNITLYPRQKEKNTLDQSKIFAKTRGFGTIVHVP